jgi:hypothetical protein
MLAVGLGHHLNAASRIFKFAKILVKFFPVLKYRDGTIGERGRCAYKSAAERCSAPSSFGWRFRCTRIPRRSRQPIV